MHTDYFQIEPLGNVLVLRLTSADGTNRLSRACVAALTEAIEELSGSGASLRLTGRGRPVPHLPLIITGNDKFFSAGADLNEITALGSDAFEFARMGQRLMQSIDD
ncbi:MAG TPA: hypothetical protein VMH85_02680, partial [Terriglobales bacterium]|nr:hypothetical protein [Terriglobales bacterium]